MEILSLVVVAIWALPCVALIFNARKWVNGIATLSVVTWGAGLWTILTESDGFAIMFAIITGPFFGPIQLGALALKAGVIGIAAALSAIAAGWTLYHFANSRFAANQMAVGVSTVFALAFGYVVATIATSTALAINVPKAERTSACIVRQPLWQMVETASYTQRDPPPHAVLWTQTEVYNWSFKTHSWDQNSYLFPAPYSSSRPKFCKRLVLQTN